MSNTKQDAWGQLIASKPTLDEVKAHFKGKGGGPEGESHIIDGQGVQLKIARKAFRGIHCAFRNVK